MKPSHVMILLLAPLAAVAEDLPETLINDVIAAYGGDPIRNLQTFEQFDRFLAPATGQSHSSAIDDINVITQRVVVDLAGDKVLFDSLFEGRGGQFQNATVNNGEKAWNINWQERTYSEANSGDVYAVAGGSMRTNDAILAHHLHKSRDDTEYKGIEKYLNRNHHVVTIPFPQSPVLTLFIDAETSFISRMRRPNPTLGNLDYIFHDRNETNGITWAGTVHFMVAGRPNLVTQARNVKFNERIDPSIFELPDGVDPSPHTPLDTAEMTTTRIAEGIWHVGQGNAYSLFIDSPAGLIATGGGAGLGDRIAAFRRAADVHRPLAYQIITHHHFDHTPGVADAASAGATLVTVSEDVDAVNRVAGPFSSDQFLMVDQRLTLGSGRDRVEIYDVSTAHAAHFLVTWLPRHKLVFMADHFVSGNVDDIPSANQNTLTMHRALTDLGLDIDRIAVAHAPRIYTWREMEQSVANFTVSGCDGDRPVCP